jgi:chaperone modulatory protein CbpM
MKLQPRNPSWLEPSENLTLSQLAHQSGFSVDELLELVKGGALRPLQIDSDEPMFNPACVSSLRKTCTLRADHNLDLSAIGVLIGYVHRIEELEQEVRNLKAHLPPHVVPAHREGPPPWREQHAKANAGASQ